MNKILFLFIFVFNLFLIAKEDTISITVVPECEELYSDYIYFKERSENEISEDLSERWKVISDDYNNKYIECSKLVHESRKILESDDIIKLDGDWEKLKIPDTDVFENKFYRENPYSDKML